MNLQLQTSLEVVNCQPSVTSLGVTVKEFFQSGVVLLCLKVWIRGKMSQNFLTDVFPDVEVLPVRWVCFLPGSVLTRFWFFKVVLWAGSPVLRWNLEPVLIYCTETCLFICCVVKAELWLWGLFRALVWIFELPASPGFLGYNCKCL